MILHPFIGLDDSGKLRIHISPFKLYPLSPMHKRKDDFPSGCDGIVEQDIEEALQKMKDYFQEHEARKPKKK